MSKTRLFFIAFIPFLLPQLLTLPVTGGPEYAKGWGEYGAYYAIAIHMVLFVLFITMLNWSITKFVHRRKDTRTTEQRKFKWRKHHN